jgi:hypothetical protein
MVIISVQRWKCKAYERVFYRFGIQDYVTTGKTRILCGKANKHGPHMNTTPKNTTAIKANIPWSRVMLEKLVVA